MVLRVCGAGSDHAKGKRNNRLKGDEGEKTGWLNWQDIAGLWNIK